MDAESKAVAWANRAGIRIVDAGGGCRFVAIHPLTRPAACGKSL